MKDFRKAIVAGYEFFWNYHFDCFGYKEPSYLYAKLANNEDAEIKVFFKKADAPEKKFPLNKGLPAKLNGQDVTISLNQVDLVSDILLELLLFDVDFDKKQKYEFQHGEEILRNMGYEF